MDKVIDFSDVMVRHGVSNHYPQIKTGLFCFQTFVHDKPQGFVILVYYDGNPSAEGDSPHKGPVMWKVFPRHDV